MGVEFQTVALTIKDIDLNPRFRVREKQLPDLIEIKLSKKSNSYSVQKDEHGEYTFSLENIQLNREGYQEFYDGDVKILESYYDDSKKSVSINVLTAIQTNLFVDFDADECIVNAASSLCIDGKFKIKSTLSISAENLCLLDTIDCDGQVALTAQQGMRISSLLKAKNVYVDAAYMHQSADVLVECKYDVSVQAFQQAASSKTDVGSLRFLTQQCEISGDLHVREGCRLVANALTMGDSTNKPTNIQLSNNHYVHAISGVIQGDSHVLMGDADNPATQTSKCIYDEHLFIDLLSTLDIKNSTIDINVIKNKGNLHINKCDVSIENMEQNGFFKAINSDIIISRCFNHESSDKSIINKSTFSSQSTTVDGGSFVFNDSEWSGYNVDITSGLLQIEKKSEIYLQDSITTDENSHFEMVDSQLRAENSVLFYGAVTLDHATIDSKEMCLQKNELSLDHTRINSTNMMLLNGYLDVSNSVLRSKNIQCSGAINFDGVMIYADKLDYNSQQAVINQTISSADIITIHGSDLKDGLIFTGGELIAKTYSVRKQVCLKDADLIGVDDANMRHDIQGKLTLEHSNFITDSHISHLKESHLDLCSTSSVRAASIYSDGDVSADKSMMHCDSFSQNGASLHMQSSELRVKNKLRTSNTEIGIENQSSLSATDMILGNETRLRLSGKSVLVAEQKIITGSDATIDSDQSVLKAQKFVFLGRAELQKTLLSGKELLIFNQLDAKDKTVINVEEQISLAKTAKVQLESSAMISRDIDSFGNLAIAGSSVNAKNAISLWTDSGTELKGAASISAHDAVVRGAIITRKKIVEGDNKPSTPEPKPRLQIENQLHISPNAHVKGNEDLVIDADEINWLGTVDLEAYFCAKGRKLSNTGSIAASSIYLGFDDAVINHGSFSSKSMTVHSNFFNLLGQVYAQKTFACSGFMSVNLGLVAANNYTNDSFVSLNAGLIAPNFSAEPKYLFSFSNLFSVAKTAAMMTMPAHVNGIQLVSMIPGLISTAGSIYSLSNKLELESLKKMRRHEIMPILCQAKNVVLFGQGLVNTTNAFGSELETWETSFSNLIHQPKAWGSDAWSAMEAADWNKMGMRAAGTFAGSYNDNSLLHVNMGGSFVGNTFKTSLFHVNAGAEQSLCSHNINTCYLHNSGTSIGREASYSATSIKNSGTLKGTNQYTVRASKVDNAKTGVLEGKRANIEIGELQQGGELNIDGGRLNITVLTDNNDSHTTLTDVALHGTTLDLTGASTLKNVLIEEDEHVHTTADATVVTDNVTIETKTFTHGGQLDYQHGLTIKAETATFAKGSVVGGQKTAEDDLFVPKQTEESAETNTETAKEPEKEFQPQHVLSILANKTTLSGKLSGGDYTIIKGNGEDTLNEDSTKNTTLCEQLTIDDSADIDLKYGSISARKGEASGTVVLDSFNVTIKEGVLNQCSTVTLKNSSYTGNSLLESGSLILDHSSVNVTHTHLTQQGHELLIDSTMSSQNMVDESQMSYQGQSGIVTDAYEHTGHVSKIALPDGSEETNLFYVKAKTAKLDGSTDLDNGYYDIEHLGDGTQFAAGTGKYSLYLSSESLTFKTEDSFRLYESIQRNCDVSVEAADIVYGGTINQHHDLTFISTLGDVSLTSTIQTRNLFVKSAKNIYTNSSISTESILSFEATGGYYNYGGTLNGNDVAVKASEIKNYTQGSNGAAGGTVLPMGGAGIINARNNLFLQATQDNIENHGGILRAGNYAQLLASGDVLNLCNTRTYQGQYDTLQQFDGGLISGGHGKDTDGIGLYIKAEGQVISDASDFVSNGSNYIEGVHGVQFTAKSHTAITKNETTKTWYGKKKTVVETSTVIKGCNIQSSNGRNIIQSGEGSVSSVASRFISPGGTDISAKGDVKLFSLRTQDRRVESTSKLWGLSKKETDSIHQNAMPTLFYDNGATRIHSTEGSVDARGAYFIGAGDLSITAKGKIIFGVDILNHEVNEKSNSFNVSAPGMGAWNTYKQGGNAWDIVTSEDATLAKMNSLCGSGNAAEVLANSSNLGIDLCNTTNSIMRGLGEGGFSSELLARYGLGGATGFSPSLTLSMTQLETKSTFQTQSQGGVDRGGNAVFKAGEGIVLENGVRVHMDGNIEVDAPEVIAQAAELHSSVTQTTVSESIGITPLSGQVQSVGVSYSKMQTQSTTYKNAELSAGGNISLHNQDKAMERVELDGANISSKTLDMNTDTLVIRDRQDTSQTKSESFSVSSNGQFSVYEGKGHEKVTNQSSGIYVADGINTDGHTVHAGETYLEGGKIITDGENHFETDKMVSKSLADEKTFNGIGISGNINDFNRLTGQTPANTAGEQAIATAAFTFDHVDYKTTEQSVIYGAQGTYLDIKETLGDAIHTTSSDGKIVQKDESMHLHVDIPITNEDYLKACAENIKAGGAKLVDIFMPDHDHKEPVDVGRGGPIIPVEDKKEEKDIEDEKLGNPKDKHAKKPGHHPKKGSNEFDLTPEETKEIVGEALQHLKFDSPKKKAEFQKTVEKANHEIDKNGKVSPKTESKLKKQVTEALIKTLKAGSEAKWGKLIDKLGPDYKKTLIKMLSNPETAANVGIKTYMGAKGVVISFAYNLALGSMDSEVKKGDVIKHAAMTTGVDITFDFVVQITFRQASGPVGAGMFVFSVVDSFYDQNRIDAQNASGVSYLYESQKLSQQGHPIDAWATRQAAADQMGTAARTQAGHDLANITKPIVDKIENKWNDFWNKPKQNTKAPAAVDPKLSTQGMFNSTLIRPGTDEFKLEQLGIR